MSSYACVRRPLNRTLIVSVLLLALCAAAASAAFDLARAAAASAPQSADAGGASVATCGGKIAVVSNRDGNALIYLMNPDGSGVTPVSTGGDQTPSLSLDGSRITFVSDRDGDYRDLRHERRRLGPDERQQQPAGRP